jgi:short-subunit dehydrogenase involved in D-alanine esterification of teichoic acids
MKTDGNRVLITGGGSGIGLSLAKKFIENGNTVIAYDSDSKALRHAKNELPDLVTIQGDVRDFENIDQIMEDNDINILINNAGLHKVFSFFKDLNLEDIINEIDVNFKSYVVWATKAVNHLKNKSQAAIINITSGLGIIPKSSAAVYSATKAGIHSFTESMRRQLLETPIRVIEVLPPIVDTPMTAGRGINKISVQQVADEFWQAFANGDTFIPIGDNKQFLSMDPRKAQQIIERDSDIPTPA